MASLPPLAAEVTDPVTAQMCTETGHSCIACPQDVRNLAATAHNAHGAVIAALKGHGGWDRARRKLASLERALETFKQASDARVRLAGLRKPSPRGAALLWLAALQVRHRFSIEELSGSGSVRQPRCRVTAFSTCSARLRHRCQRSATWTDRRAGRALGVGARRVPADHLGTAMSAQPHQPGL